MVACLPIASGREAAALLVVIFRPTIQTLRQIDGIVTVGPLNQSCGRKVRCDVGASVRVAVPAGINTLRYQETEIIYFF